MAADDLATWRRESLAELGRTISALRKIKKGIDRACDGVKTTAKRISKEAERKLEACERALAGVEDGEDDYYALTDLKGALEEVGDADEQADDAKLQIGDSIDSLLERLEEIKESVKAVDG